MLDHSPDYAGQPLVSVIFAGPRYSATEIASAFSVSAPTAPAVSQSHAAKEESGPIARDMLDAFIDEAASATQQAEPELWAGDWSACVDPFTGEASFPSQSEADYALCRRIAYALAAKGVIEEDLPELVQGVFEQSGLSARAKWKERADYRARTLEAACDGIAPAVQATFAGLTNPTAAPDWALECDVRNARFFADLMRDQLVYVYGRERWLIWHEGRWRWCEKGEEIEAAKQAAVLLLRAARLRQMPDEKSHKSLLVDVKAAQRESQLGAMLKLARSEPGMGLAMTDLERDPMLLGVENGVVDLRTGKLRRNEPSLYITRFCDAPYDPGKDCPRWKKFLSEVLDDRETVRSAQLLLGQTLTGEIGGEHIVFCVGHGANGKSIFGNVVARILRSYAVTAPTSLLAARRSDDHGPRSDLAMLAGSRLVSVNELPGGMTLDEVVVKQLAGREAISARFLHREFFDFWASFTPWLRTNHKPIVKGTDEGIWRRLVILRFGRTFTPEEQDPDLESKLLAEREGILAWMVQGAVRYHADGIELSPKMQAELGQYRSESDLLGEFLADWTETGVEHEVEQARLYGAYQRWSERNGLHPCTKRALTERLTERGFGTRKSGATRYYTGVGLADLTDLMA